MSARGRVSASGTARLAAAERRAARARLRVPGLLGGKLPRHDDRGDRPRSRRHGADPLPPLRLEARPLPRLPRRGLGAGARDLGRGRRERARSGDWARRWLAPGAPRGSAIRDLSSLWMQALVEASEDRRDRRYMREHMREVHAYVADVLAPLQEAGGVLPERDVDAEAWIFPRDRAPADGRRSPRRARRGGRPEHRRRAAAGGSPAASSRPIPRPRV